MSGYCTPHWKAWHPPIDHPATSLIRSTPRCSVSSRCCSRTLSNSVTRGNRAALNGASVLLGDDETPPDIKLVSTTKCLSGSIARPCPTRHSSDSRCVPEYQDGMTTTLSRLGDRRPSALKARRATGNALPFCKVKLGASK